MQSLRRANLAVDQLNQIRLRQSPGSFMSSAHVAFWEYISGRMNNKNDYTLLRRALGAFGEMYFSPLIEEAMGTRIREASDRVIDIGCGTGWLSRAINPKSLLMLDRPDVPPPAAGATQDWGFQGIDIESQPMELWKVINSFQPTLVLLSEVLHCLAYPQDLINCLAKESVPFVFMLEQHAYPDTSIGKQLQEDLGEGNNARLFPVLASYLQSKGYELDNMVRVKQYTFSLWWLRGEGCL